MAGKSGAHFLVINLPANASCPAPLLAAKGCQFVRVDVRRPQRASGSVPEDRSEAPGKFDLPAGSAGACCGRKAALKTRALQTLAQPLYLETAVEQRSREDTKLEEKGLGAKPPASCLHSQGKPRLPPESVLLRAFAPSLFAQTGGG